MTKDNRIPSETTLALLKELSTAIQPRLRLVEEDLALACAAESDSFRERLLSAKEGLAELGARLEKLIVTHGQPPAAVGETPTPPAKERILFAPHARRHRRQYMKILLVEDSPVSNAITKAMLEQQGWRVSGVLSGREALEKLIVKSAYDLIITDLMMEPMNGLELAREIRKFERKDPNTLAHTREGRPPIPIVALTANENPAALGECLEAGIDDIVIKSTSFDSLIASIEKQIDKSGEEGRVE